MFTGATSFNQPIGSWDVSSLENAFVMFKEATSFNQPLGKWNTTSLRNANGMFAHATSFNQNLSKWDISKVMELDFMFGGCKNFNQDLSKWDVKGKYFRDMLYDTPIQNEPKKTSQKLQISSICFVFFEPNFVCLQRLSHCKNRRIIKTK